MRYRNLDPATGAPLTLSDVFRDGYEAELLPLAEPKFRAARQIEDGVSLQSAGFRFENGTFALTDNFCLGEDEISFYYNPDEIAPAPLGPTEIVFGYDELSSLLKE